MKLCMKTNASLPRFWYWFSTSTKDSHCTSIPSSFASCHFVRRPLLAVFLVTTTSLFDSIMLLMNEQVRSPFHFAMMADFNSSLKGRALYIS